MTDDTPRRVGCDPATEPGGWVAIRYGAYWDFPRTFLARYRGSLLLFDGSAFDEAADDFAPNFDVLLLSDLPPLNHAPAPQSLPGGTLRGSPAELRAYTIRTLSPIPAERSLFDPTRRKAIREDVLQTIGREAALW